MAVVVDGDERWWWQVSGTVFGAGDRRMSETRSLPDLALVCLIPNHFLCIISFKPHLTLFR